MDNGQTWIQRISADCRQCTPSPWQWSAIEHDAEYTAMTREVGDRQPRTGSPIPVLTGPDVTDSHVAVTGDQYHHPDGHQLDNVCQRPGQYLVVRIDTLQVRELATQRRHGRVHLDSSGCRQEHVVADRQRLEQVRGHGLAPRPPSSQDTDWQTVADEAEDADKTVQRSVDGEEEPRVGARNAAHRIARRRFHDCLFFSFFAVATVPRRLVVRRHR